MSDFYTEVMGQPTITRAQGTFNTSGDNTIVAAPGSGKFIAITYLHIQNESTTGTTSLIKHGATSVARVLLQTQAQMWWREFECPMVLPANTALVVNLSGANSHNYTVEYVTMFT